MFTKFNVLIIIPLNICLLSRFLLFGGFYQTSKDRRLAPIECQCAHISRGLRQTASRLPLGKRDISNLSSSNSLLFFTRSLLIFLQSWSSNSLSPDPQQFPILTVCLISLHISCTTESSGRLAVQDCVTIHTITDSMCLK